MRIRHLAPAVLVTAALALAGCSAGATPEDETTDAPAPSESASGIALPASIEEKGAIDIGVYFNYPPYTYAEGDELKGIEADLANAVGEALGVEVRFHDLAFEAMVPAVMNGRVDMLIGPMADNEERRKEVSFIDTLETKLRALVKKGNPTGFDIENPCGAKGGEVAASNNLLNVQAISDACMADGEQPLDILTLGDNGAVIQAVLNERTQFTAQEPGLATFMVESNPDLELQGEVFDSVDGGYQGWVFAKDNDELIETVLAAIDALMENGTWESILDEAGLLDSAVIPVRVNGEVPSK